LSSQRTPQFEHYAFTYLLHVSTSASVFFPVYVIVILPDEGSNKRPKHLAEDKQTSNTFHLWCQIYIKSHLPVLNTSRFKIGYNTELRFLAALSQIRSSGYSRSIQRVAVMYVTKKDSIFSKFYYQLMNKT